MVVSFYIPVEPLLHLACKATAEHAIHTVTEGACAMLYTSKLPKNLWSIAVKTMAYLCNQSPTWANEGMTPIEHITGKKPNLAHLKVFGCPTNIAVPKEKKKKWDSGSQMRYMVGYELYSMGYLIWFPSSSHVEKARDVIFHEEAITPAVLTLYDDDNAPRNVSEQNIKMIQLTDLIKCILNSLYTSPHALNILSMVLKTRTIP